MISHFDNATALTTSDTTTYSPPLDAIYVGGAGNLAVRTLSGTTLTFTAVPVGGIIPVRVDRVMATNTTATLLIGLRLGYQG